MRFFALLSCVALSASCAQTPQASSLKHDFGHPVNAPDAWNWTHDTEADYFATVAPFNGNPTDPARYLPAEHPLRVRVNHWLATIHTALVAAHPDELKNVPQPEVEVLITADVNAFVAALPTCLTNAKVNFGGAGKSIKGVMLYDGEFAGTNIKHDIPCAERSATRAELEDRIARNFPKGDCPIKLDEDTSTTPPTFTLSPDRTCAVPPALLELAGADQLIVLSTSHWVTVFTGIAKTMTERQIVGVLSHELGHYYRSHLTMSHRYDYAYQLTFDHPASMPKVSSEDSSDPKEVQLAEFSKSLRVWQAQTARLETEKQTRLSLAPSGVYVKVPGQRFHSGLLPLVIEATRYSESCWMSLGDPSLLHDLSGEALLMAPLSNANRAKYLAFETWAGSCLANQPATGTPFSVGDILDQELHGFEVGRYFPTGGGPKTGSLAAYFDGMTTTLNQVYPEYSISNATNFLGQWQLRKDAGAQEDALQSQSAGFESYLNANLVGLYSYEQEADELSGEFLHQISADPENSVEVDMTFAKMFPGEPTAYEDCKAARDAGWHKNGEEWIVPIGHLEFHHQDCFRAFNLDRDIVAHGYTGPYTATFMPEADWTALQSSLPPITTTPPHPATPATTVHAAGGIGFPCIYGGTHFNL